MSPTVASPTKKDGGTAVLARVAFATVFPRCSFLTHRTGHSLRCSTAKDGGDTVYRDGRRLEATSCLGPLRLGKKMEPGRSLADVGSEEGFADSRPMRVEG